MQPRRNPVAARLIRSHKPFPSLGTAAAAAGVVGFLSVVVVLLGLVNFQLGFWSVLGAVFVVLAWMLTLNLANFCTRVAATLAANDAQSEEYQLFRLTTLPEETRIWGYVLATLHRARAPIAIITGLLPALILGTTLLIFGAQGAFVPETAFRSAPVIRLGSQLIKLVAVGVGLWGVIPMGSALGAGFGLWWQNRTLAGYAAATLSGLSMVTLIVLTMFGFIGPFWQYVFALLLMPLPWLGTLTAVRWAARFSG